MNLEHLKWYKVNTLARGITHPTHISKIKYESYISLAIDSKANLVEVLAISFFQNYMEGI